MMDHLYQHRKTAKLTGFKHPVTVSDNDIHIDVRDARNLTELMQISDNIEWVRENLADQEEPPYWRIHVGAEVIGIHEGMYREFYQTSNSGDVFIDHIESMLTWLKFGAIPGFGSSSSPGRPHMPPMKPRSKKKLRRAND